MAVESKDGYDAIVVGSGPGGCTVARELARAGRKVLILEKGRDYSGLGTYRTALRAIDQSRSREGLSMLRASTTGGATVFYSASAADPPPWLATRHGIDLSPLLDEIKRETRVHVLPEGLLGRASVRVMETANRLGYRWEPMPKFLDPVRFVDGRCCGANTHLGCTCGAKWTAREYLGDAVAAGAELLTETECERVLVENGTAVGVQVKDSRGARRQFRASEVILSAGGLYTPLLLKRAGIEEAGEGCFMDPTVVVYGEAPFEGNWADPPVSVVTWEFYDSDGIRIGTIMEPRLLLAVDLLRVAPLRIRAALNYRNIVGILVKVKDDLSGRVLPDGSVSKKLNENDEGRLRKGVEVSREILRALGCPAKSIVVGETKGAHPSGTCRIGHLLSKDLKTEIPNLYVCDASVFPEALDRPTVITIIAFGKRLAAHLLGLRAGAAGGSDAFQAA
jgi:choline dehydrogenase-like flavoprotein